MEIKAFADSNWLVAAYFIKVDEARTALVQRFTKKFEAPWLVAPIAILECRNVFASMSGETNSMEWTTLQRDLGMKLMKVNLTWDEVTRKAEETMDRFSARRRIGTLDMLLLASALKAEATHFLSFDTNSNLRALAAVLKLKVFPELTADDKRRMASFR